MKKNAYAKVNLTLDIVSKRPDGYHNVDMIMQKISLCDVITCEKSPSGINLSGTGSLAYDSTNLAYKAAKLFFDETGIDGGAAIYIEKNIPFCAGMGGGSSDAATVMEMLNDLYGMPLSLIELMKLSANLGADVPFFLGTSTARATGIGDEITPLASLPQKHIVIAKPPVAVSTPAAYASVNLGDADHPDTSLACSALSGGDISLLYSLMGNTFEKSIFRRHPVIGNIKKEFLHLGAQASLMSGSGSAVFAIFEDEKKAQNAYDIMSKQYEETFLGKTLE